MDQNLYLCHWPDSEKVQGLLHCNVKIHGTGSDRGWLSKMWLGLSVKRVTGAICLTCDWTLLNLWLGYLSNMWLGLSNVWPGLFVKYEWGGGETRVTLKLLLSCKYYTDIESVLIDRRSLASYIQTQELHSGCSEVVCWNNKHDSSMPPFNSAAFTGWLIMVFTGWFINDLTDWFISVL